MTGPNIDMVSASLRSCSLCEDAAPSLPAGGNPTIGGGIADSAVELNSELALPYHWEQCLDLKTGKLYYINWHTREKSTEDPRKLAAFCGSCDSGEDDNDDGHDADDEDDGADAEDHEDEGSSEGEAAASESGDGYGHCSSAFSSSSSPSSASSMDPMEQGPVLVAAGCRACMMYVMIPKGEEQCPRCGGHVISFGRSLSR